MTHATTLNLAALKQQLQLNDHHADAFLNSFLQQLQESQATIEPCWRALIYAMTETEQQRAIKQLERAVHKLKGATCYGHVPILNHACTTFGMQLQQQLEEQESLSPPKQATLANSYYQLLAAIVAVQSAQSPAQNLDAFLKQWDSAYQDEASQLRLFDTQVTGQWCEEQKQQFTRLFYHARGHFYKFLWLLGNEAPSREEKITILDNIEEEFGRDGLSHEQMYYAFAEAVGMDVSDEFFYELHHCPYLQHYNLGHLTWLTEQDWSGKWAGVK
jgi:HPt (histidine-containing phosphotransfer) domain-containing protein